MRRIDDYSLEVLLTLALAFGGYQLAVLLHVSAPIMAVCAGLLIGDAAERRSGVSEHGREYLDAFWKLVDEILNAVLFLMIGVEVFAVAFEFDFVVAGVLSIALALLGRLAAVAIPVLILKPFRGFSRGVIPIMTWGGIKGGISIALALSLPAGGVAAADPDGDLRGGDLLDPRAGPDGRARRDALRGGAGRDLMRYEVWDVFTEAPFAGNPLAVVWAQGLADDAMLRIAREFGYSETTFVAPVPDGAEVRIWTPAEELPFAGHPLIGTACALASDGAGPDLTLRIPVGPVAVQARAAGGGRDRGLRARGPARPDGRPARRARRGVLRPGRGRPGPAARARLARHALRLRRGRAGRA